MARCRVWRIILLLSAVGALPAAEWWERKPHSEWTRNEVTRLLDDSPWGKVYTVTIMNPMYTGQRTFQSLGTGDMEREKRNRFHLRFLTAKPVRMAFARQLALEKKGPIDAAGVQQFVDQTDPENIIMVLNVSAIPASSSTLHGYWSTLMRLTTPDLVTDTALSTNTGKRVYLNRYKPPAGDGLGARLYFPRKMPDGTSFVTAADREVHFQMVLELVEFGTMSGTPSAAENRRSDRLWLSFDVRKMFFEGKLEF